MDHQSFKKKLMTVVPREMLQCKPRRKKDFKIEKNLSLAPNLLFNLMTFFRKKSNKKSHPVIMTSGESKSKTK
jgi:hypothetical protein